MNILIKPPKSLLRCVGRAIADFQMIQANDRVLLGVSGGKDSLSLLHILRHLQHHAPIHFELGVITIDPKIPGFDPSPLKDYLATLDIPYFYQTQPILDEALQHIKGDSFCAYCARMKRGIMYTLARQEGYKVLALAQHLDDLAESFFMSVLYNGKLHTMKANYINDAGDIRIIRPLVYARERQMSDFAQQVKLPVILDNCPACFSAPTQRDHIKQWLATEELQSKYIFSSVLQAMRPLMQPNQLTKSGK